LVENINLKRLISDFVEEGGLGLFTKSQNHKMVEMKEGTEPRKLIREKLLIMECVESTTPGYSGVVHHIGQEGAEGGRIQKSLTFDKQFIQLDDPTCSRRHFHIKYNDKINQYEISDLGSTSGILIRIEYNNGGYHLSEKDIICFGKHQLRIEEIKHYDTSLTESKSSDHDDDSSSNMILKCISPIGSPLENQIFNITNKGGTIGRNNNNDISFTIYNENSNKYVGVDGAISNEHARIECFQLPAISSLHHQSSSIGGDRNGNDRKKFVLLDGSDKKPSSNGSWLKLSSDHEETNHWALLDRTEFVVGGSRFKVSFGFTVRVIGDGGF